MNDTDQQMYPDWMSSTDNVPSDIGNSSRKSPDNNRSKKALSISLCVLAVLVALGLSAWFYIAANKTTCLTTEDFTELTGDSYILDDIDTIESFHDYTFGFLPDSYAYDASEAEDRDEVINNIAGFYEKHKNKPIIFTIRAYGTDESDKALSKMRQDAIKNSLTSVGIPSDQIKTDTVAVNTVADDEESFDEDLDAVTLSITSAESCKK